jgi:protein-disulfide isomerase
MIAVATVAVVLAVALGGGRSSAGPNVPAIGSLDVGVPGAAEVSTRLAGIPQHGMTLGSRSAPVTLVEYVDLQCPYCKRVENEVLPGIVERYVRTGKAKIVARPLAFVGGDSSRGRDAVIAAASQDRAFNLAALLFVNQGQENTGWLSEDMVANAAASIPGLRVHDLLTLRHDPAIAKVAAGYDAVAKAGNVNSTPTFVVVGDGGGSKTIVAPSAAALAAAIEQALP